MGQNFKTIYKHAEIELFEKGSRFIGHAFPLESEEAALGQIAALRKVHAKAHHNCFAYQIQGIAGLARNDGIVRQSDDGEPSGTAGMPILDFIQKQGLRNILLVVTRYFGGTLLGTGGLVRAYGRAAKEAAHAAIIIEKNLYQKFVITVPYALGGKVEYEIRGQNHILTNILYTDNISFEVLAEDARGLALTKHITNITSATANIANQGTVYCALVGGEYVIF